VFAKLFYPKMDGVGAAERPRVLHRERECLLEMTALASRLKVLGDAGHVAESVIREFADMAWQFAERCSRSNNVRLNQMVHRVLEFGQRSGQPFQLRKKCRQTSEYLKNI
jgi:hypothetical protein